MKYEVIFLKKILFLVFLSFLFLLNVNGATPEISSKNAILLNGNDGTILYEKNAEEIVSIASLTKIMTAIVALEQIKDLEESIILQQEDFVGLREANASVAGFKINEEVTYKDLMYGLLFPSGADAAQALTRLLGGKAHFINLMNEKAKELGLEKTSFKNETGLEEIGHHSTVKDVATFFLYALENEEFQEFVTTPTYTTKNKQHTFLSTLENYHKKYQIEMDYLQGGKTGWTSEAGLCLATYAYKNNNTYVFVTAGSYNGGASHINDAKKVYDYYIENFENQILVEKESKILELPTLIGGKMNFYAEKNITAYLPKEIKKEEITLEYVGEKKIYPWTKKDTLLGHVKVKYLGKVIDKIEIYQKENLSYPYLWGILGIGIFFFIKKRNRKKRRKMLY